MQPCRRGVGTWDRNRRGAGLPDSGRPSGIRKYVLPVDLCLLFRVGGHGRSQELQQRHLQMHSCMQRRGFLDHPRNDTLSFCRCPAAVLINHPTTGYTSARGSTSMAPSPCHHVHVLQCNHTELVAVFSHTRTQCLSDRIRTTHASYIFVLLALHAPSNHHHPIARLPFDA